MSVSMLSFSMQSVFIMLSVGKLSFIMLSVIMLSVIMLSVIMLSIIMLSVIMLVFVMQSVIIRSVGRASVILPSVMASLNNLDLTCHTQTHYNNLQIIKIITACATKSFYM